MQKSTQNSIVNTLDMCVELERCKKNTPETGRGTCSMHMKPKILGRNFKHNTKKMSKMVNTKQKPNILHGLATFYFVSQ